MNTYTLNWQCRLVINNTPPSLGVGDLYIREMKLNAEKNTVVLTDLLLEFIVILLFLPQQSTHRYSVDYIA